MRYFLKDFSVIRILGCFIFVSCLSANSQDSLVYKNGVNLAVKIVSVSQRNQTIEYVLEEREKVVTLQAIARYKNKDSWIEVNATENTAIYPVELKSRLVDRNFLDVRSSLSVGTNISSLLSPNGSGLNHSIRKLLTIEPEYRLSNEWLSIKGNLDIGLPFPEVGVFPQFYSQDGTYYYADNGILNYNIYSYENNTTISAYKNYYRPDYIDRYIPMQWGLTLKFWPSQQFRERFFLHVGFVAGIADYKAVTIFDSFESTVDQWGNLSFNYVNRNVEVQSNEYVFVRPELGFGYNFILHKNFSFNIDLTVMHNPKNKGVLPDIVYARIDNGEYQKEYEGIDAYPNWANRFNFSNNFLLRFKLIYHFNKP